MQTKENLSQTVKDVKVEIIKEELLDAIEEGVRKFVRTTLEVYAKDEFLRYIGARPYERTEKRKDYRNGSLLFCQRYYPIGRHMLPRERN